MTYITTIALLVLLFTSATQTAAQSGSGTTTRYWDCCKPSCAWSTPGITSPVKIFSISDTPLPDASAQSGCAGGSAYMCSDQSPWAISDTLAYGFAAVGGGGGSDAKCCSCYALTFTSSVLQGKKMVVQATNTGNDVGSTQFDLAIPGGGFGQFDGCSTEWKATSAIWGARYGGPSSNTCSSFPSALQPGCGFRWGWMQGADNPTVDWEVVTCPSELVAKSGCSVTGYDGSSNAPSASASSAVAPPPLSSVSSPSPPPSSAVIQSPVETPEESPTPNTSTASAAAAAAATTLSSLLSLSPSSALAVPSAASPPPIPHKAAPAHPHWSAQPYKAAPKGGEDQHADWSHHDDSHGEEEAGVTKEGNGSEDEDEDEDDCDA